MRRLAVTGLVLLLGACAVATGEPTTTTSTTTTTTTTTTPASSTTTTSSTTSTTQPTTTTTTSLPPGVTQPPDWLGQRPLAVDEAGDPVPVPTPPELSDRRFVTVDVLPPPEDDAFHATIADVPPDVAARSTWEEGCPVSLDELAYVTLTFVGFDQRSHTGELIVNAAVAEDVVEVFQALFEARFPIETVNITTREDLDAEPTGDGNPTTAFVCRPATGGTNWSEHAYGLAIDVNPFHNPYVRGDTVLPELAGDYLDRSRDLPGMIAEGDVVTEAFDAIGWEWGGRWTSLKDWQHFSLRGR